MQVHEARHHQEWDGFLARQRFRPFLQSWTMGEVHRELGEQPVRLEVRRDDSDAIIALCLGIIVPARRGHHIAVQYGPIFDHQLAPEETMECTALLHGKLAQRAQEHQCSFLRISPFVSAQNPLILSGSRQSPMHLLGEHLWYVPLRTQDRWAGEPEHETSQPLSEDILLAAMRKTTRNLIRRAEKEGVTISATEDAARDVETFIALHDETRKRHHFTPYRNDYFRTQVRHFAPRGECSVYLARHEGRVIAASIHMHAFGETSYHHGASIAGKIPASYLLQWTAMRDALHRGDDIYNFWGIAPPDASAKHHPFAGVTTFKTGFGGLLLSLQHCTDVPLTRSYWVTRCFEYMRKWKRGF